MRNVQFRHLLIVLKRGLTLKTFKPSKPVEPRRSVCEKELQDVTGFGITIIEPEDKF